MIRRSAALISLILCVVVVAGTLDYSTAWAEDPGAWAAGTNNLRAGPGAKYPLLLTITPGTAVVIEARNTDTSWVLVHIKDTKDRGWGKTTLFKLAPTIKLRAMPISTEEIVGTAGPKPVQAVGDGTNYDDSKVQAYEIPVPPLPRDIPSGEITAPVIPRLTPTIRATLRSIYLKGKSLGNNPRVFSKVGDCHTDHPGFMTQFGTGHYELGKFGYLKAVIDFYSVPPRPDTANSFNIQSQAAHSAYNAGAVLDWQTVLNPQICMAKESPLHCEYRLNKPAVSVIMFGVVDVLVMTPEQFNLYMRYIVKDTLDRGIIPVLSTTAENASDLRKARQFNQIVIGLAREKNLPLINLEGALSTLPNKGLDPDGIHLTRPDDIAQTGYFTDGNLQFGYTMRNLVVLQTLDEIMKTVLR